MAWARRTSAGGDFGRVCIQALEPRAHFSAAPHGGEPPGAHHLPALPSGALDAALDPGQTVPLSAAPQLSSYAASPVKLFLSFVGAAATNWGPYHVPTTPAYDLDGDPTSFSQAELDGIHDVWQRVAEKFAPFNVNVTTVDPGSYNYFETVRVVVGGDGAWTGGVYGGYGYIDGFSGATSNTAWVFPKNLGKGRPKYAAEAVSHEAGHNFGLFHQSSYSGNVKTDEYNHGTPDAAPIMGFSYLSQRGKWWKGPANSPFSIQNDLQVLGETLGPRPDDHAGTAAAATALEVLAGGDVTPAAGVIETTADVDYFHFHTAGGQVNLAADVAPLGPTLDLTLRLLDPQGNTLAFEDTADFGERVVTLLPEGDYYLAVASHGAYGDVGQYTISGTTVPEPAALALVTLAGIASLFQRRPRATPHGK